MFVRKAGVVGAGAMGSQIAEVLALNGYDVYINDISSDILNKGMARIKSDLESLVEFHKKKSDREIERIRVQDDVELSEEQRNAVRAKLRPSYDERRASEILSRIHPTEGLSALAEVDFVVEAVVEQIDEKKKVFRALDAQVPRNVILATNTSTLSITEIASAARRRSSKIIGTHFFNPPITLPLVEVIPGLETSEETLSDVMEFISSLRNHRYPMLPVKVKEVPGFLVNRILGAMLNEAYALYEEGVASMRDIDQAMKTGAGMPMGPFELSDLIGIDVLYHVEESIREMEGGTFLSPRPTQIIKKMFHAGRLGRKAGRGFYEYNTSSS